jgi:hypothetical protein
MAVQGLEAHRKDIEAYEDGVDLVEAILQARRCRSQPQYVVRRAGTRARYGWRASLEMVIFLH